MTSRITALVVLLGILTTGAAQAGLLVGFAGPDGNVWTDYNVGQVICHPGGGIVTILPTAMDERFGAKPVYLFTAEYKRLCELLGVKSLEGSRIAWRPMIVKGVHISTLDRVLRLAIQDWPDLRVSYPGKEMRHWLDTTNTTPNETPIGITNENSATAGN